MSVTIAELKIKISGDIKSAESDLKTIQKSFSEVETSAKKSADVIAQNFSKAMSSVAKDSQQANQAFNNLGKEANTFNGHLNKVGSEANTASGHLSKLGNAAAKDVSNGFQEANHKLGDFLASAAKIGGLAILGGIAGLTAVGTSSVKVFSDFESAINGIVAVSDDATEHLDDLKDKALELGAKFPVSSTDAANGMAELAKAGLKTNEVLGASNGLVTLAVAGQLSMERSAEILAGALAGFGLDASKASGFVDKYGKSINNADHVTDLLAKTANASSVDITDIGESFKYVAPVAKAAGYSMEDVSVAIGLMGNAMIKGSQAGTSLRGIFSRLASPPKEAAGAIKDLGVSVTDANGKMKPLIPLMEEFRVKFKNMSQVEKLDMAKKIAGQEAMSGFLALVDSSDEQFKAMKDSINDATGAAQSMADVMSGGTKGAIENLKGSIEVLQIRLGEALAPVVNIAAGFLANLANKAADAAKKLAGPVKDGIKLATDAFNTFKGALSGNWSRPIIDGANIAKVALANGLSLQDAAKSMQINPIVAKVGELGEKIRYAFLVAKGAIYEFKQGIKGFATDNSAEFSPVEILAGKVGTAFKQLHDTLGPIVSKAVELYLAFSPFTNALKILEGFLTGGLMGGLNSFRDVLSKIAQELGYSKQEGDQFANTVVQNLVDAFRTVAQFVVTTLIPALQNIGNFIQSTVIPAIQQFAGWVATNVIPILKSMGDTFVNTILPALLNFGNFITTTVVPKLQELAVWIGDNIVPLLEKFANFIATTVVPMIGNLAAFIMSTVIPALTQWWSILATVLAPVISELANFIGNEVLPRLSDIGNFIMNQVIPALTQMWNWIQTNVMPILQTLAGFLGGALKTGFENFGDIVKFVWDGIQNVITTVWGVVKGIWDTITALLRGDLSGAFEGLKEVASSVWNGIQGVISNVWGVVSGIFNNIVNFVKDNLGGAFTFLENIVKTVWDNITNGIKSAVDNIKNLVGNVVNFFKELPGKLVDAVVGGVGALLDAGRKLIGGLIDGIKNVHIPFPHFKVTMGSVNIAGVDVPMPNFNVEWYDKGGIFNGAQVIGVGEKRSEAVLPLDEIKPLFRSAASDLLTQTSNSSSSNQTISIGDIYITLPNSSSLKNIDEAKLAKLITREVKDQLNDLSDRKKTNKVTGFRSS